MIKIQVSFISNTVSVIVLHVIIKYITYHMFISHFVISQLYVVTTHYHVECTLMKKQGSTK